MNPLPILKRFRDNAALQSRLARIAWCGWILTAVTALLLIPCTNRQVAEDLGHAAAYGALAAVAAYHALKFMGRGFALLLPVAAGLLLCGGLWLVVLAMLLRPPHPPAPPLPVPAQPSPADERHLAEPDELDTLTDALCDPAFRALRVPRQLDYLEKRSPRFAALDQVERRKLLLQPKAQPGSDLCAGQPAPVLPSEHD